MNSPVLRSLSLVSILLLAGLAGCGGGGGGKEPLDPPTNFAVHWSPDYEDTMVTSWTAPTCEFDGYNMEYQVDSGAYIQQNTGLIHAAWTQFSFPMVLQYLPELVPLHFRMNTCRIPNVSAYTPIATVMTRIRAPKIVSTSYRDGQATVAWTNNSRVADTLVLERGVASPSAPDSNVWTRLPSVRFGDLQYTDPDVPEGVFVTYRVTYAKGDASMSARSYPFTSTISAPTQVVATPGPASVHLAWTNQTAGATSVVILRQVASSWLGTFTEVATLPPTATSYDDLGLAPGPYVYQVQARNTGLNLSASSPTVAGAALPAAIPGLPLEGASVQWPDVSTGALRQDGTWVLGNLRIGFGTVQVYLPSGDTWISRTFPSATQFAEPGILLDAAGQPHLVYLRPATQGSTTQVLVHTWFDGSAWQDETLATADRQYASYDPILACLDKAGNPVVVASLALREVSCTLKGEDGTWTTESLAAIQPGDGNGWSHFALTLDAAGVPAVAIANAATWRVGRRTGPQAWQGETVPRDLPDAASLSRLDLAATADGDLHLLVGRRHLPVTPESYELVWSRRTSGTWSVPTALVSASARITTTGEVLTSPAGDRILCSANHAAGRMILVYAQGAWVTANLGLGYAVGPILAFSPQGRCRLVFGAPRVGSGRGGTTTFSPNASNRGFPKEPRAMDSPWAGARREGLGRRGRWCRDPREPALESPNKKAPGSGPGLFRPGSGW